MAGRLAATLNNLLKEARFRPAGLHLRRPVFYCQILAVDEGDDREHTRAPRNPTRPWRNAAFAFGETSEALFLTQGFVYASAEAAEARFKGEEPGFIYSRYANPTTDMFEKRMCALEGAEDARATASGMAAVAAAIICQVKAGDHFSPQGPCSAPVARL